MEQYHQLTREERYLIALLRMQRRPVRQIAARLGRHVSTVYRELARNATTHDGNYRAEKAHRYAVARRRRCRRKPHYSAREIAVVEALLRRRWSPQQIAGALRKQRWRISMQTIYRHIRRDRKRGGQLWRLTRIISKFGRKRYRSVDYRGVLPGKRHISQRPEEANTRASFGHWEGDTVMGADQRHCILTLVERQCGYVLIRKLRQRTKEQACSAALQVLSEHRGKFKTITFDNGTEFHDYKVLERFHPVQCYFATPYHSWERGSNENMNGLIRQYLPKGSCMRRITQTDCDRIADEINERPRKRLNYETPAALFSRS